MKVVSDLVFRGYDSSYGSGAFGASRGSRSHMGVDIIVKPGDAVYAPFDGKITKYGYLYGSDLRWRFIEITGDDYRMRIGYSELDDAHYVPKNVVEGQFLGVAQDISIKYPGIPIHLHIELYQVGSTVALDPTEYLKKKVLK